MAEHFNLPEHNHVHDMRVSVVGQVKGGTATGQLEERRLIFQLGTLAPGGLNIHFRWLSRVMQDHEARASDLNRKLMFSLFLLFFKSKLVKHNKQGPKFAVQQSPLKSRLSVPN